MARYAVLSDIHGNLQALQSVYRDMQEQDLCGAVLLGDLIDNGMQSNEVVRFIRDEFQYPIACSIWGNHERAVMLSDYAGFSTDRGAVCAKMTAAVLDSDVREYINGRMLHSGIQEFEAGGMKCLAVHGSLEDCYWQAVFPGNVHGDYSGYDVVFSGHSHYSHMFTKFYDCKNEMMRNRHAVLFVNPGSVGQPRNHHPQAQYAVLDTETLSVGMKSVPYDIRKAMSYFAGSTDDFYRTRLKYGI